jgi:hypothetical protein
MNNGRDNARYGVVKIPDSLTRDGVREPQEYSAHVVVVVDHVHDLLK